MLEAVSLMKKELQDYLDENIRNRDRILKESAEILINEIKKQMKSQDIWTGQFLNNLKYEKVDKNTYAVYSDVFYAHLVEFGHRRKRFWPLSYRGGQLTRLGAWAIDKLGFEPTGRLNLKGYMIFKTPDGEEVTGLEFKARGKKVFRRALLNARNKIPYEVELQFVTKYGGY